MPILCLRGIPYEMSEAAPANQMTPIHSERRDNWVHRSAVDRRVNQTSPQLCSVTSPGCKKTFQRIRHSTVMLTYRSDVYQVANETVVQAVPATDGLTRFWGTTTSRPLTSGGVPSIVVIAGRRFGFYWLSVTTTTTAEAKLWKGQTG